MRDKRRFAIYNLGDPSVGIPGDEAQIEISAFYFSEENDPHGEYLAWFKSRLRDLFTDIFDFDTHIEELKPH